MKRKATTRELKTEQKLTEAAERALRGDNLVDTSMGNAAKPISLYPLKTGAALASLLKVKPEPKPQK
jgi:hypothetical protein